MFSVSVRNEAEWISEAAWILWRKENLFPLPELEPQFLCNLFPNLRYPDTQLTGVLLMYIL
jgi:hypothetical protein